MPTALDLIKWLNAARAECIMLGFAHQMLIKIEIANLGEGDDALETGIRIGAYRRINGEPHMYRTFVPWETILLAKGARPVEDVRNVVGRFLAGI
jgi:hypothetical protein